VPGQFFEQNWTAETKTKSFAHARTYLRQKNIHGLKPKIPKHLEELSLTVNYATLLLLGCLFNFKYYNMTF
jgi:hypothetical protein